jgi:hypothetical protein
LTSIDSKATSAAVFFGVEGTALPDMSSKQASSRDGVLETLHAGCGRGYISETGGRLRCNAGMVECSKRRYVVTTTTTTQAGRHNGLAGEERAGEAGGDWKCCI